MFDVHWEMLSRLQKIFVDFHSKTLKRLISKCSLHSLSWLGIGVSRTFCDLLREYRVVRGRPADHARQILRNHAPHFAKIGRIRAIFRNPEHESLRLRQHDRATAPGPLYTLLVGHKKFSNLKYQATRASVGCTSRSVFFMIFSENQQIFF